MHFLIFKHALPRGQNHTDRGAQEAGGAEGREEVSLAPGKLEKYHRLMGDDIARGDAGEGTQFSPEQTGEISPGPGRLSPEERKNKLEKFFGEGDFFEKPAEGESPDAENKKSSAEGKGPEGRDEKSPAEGEMPGERSRTGKPRITARGTITEIYTRETADCSRIADMP